jgi:hypothetical protein
MSDSRLPDRVEGSSEFDHDSDEGLPDRPQPLQMRTDPGKPIDTSRQLFRGLNKDPRDVAALGGLLGGVPVEKHVVIEVPKEVTAPGPLPVTGLSARTWILVFAGIFLLGAFISILTLRTSTEARGTLGPRGTTQSTAAVTAVPSREVFMPLPVPVPSLPATAQVLPATTVLPTAAPTVAMTAKPRPPSIKPKPAPSPSATPSATMRPWDGKPIREEIE